jgi:hypothetical protein
MTGTLLNMAAILLGGSLGLFFGSRLPERLKQIVLAGMGLFTLALGVQMFLETQNALIALGSLLIGGLLGEWWKVEDGLHRLGTWLEKRLGSGPGAENRFVRGFLVTSVLFCTGPMAILGSIQDGLRGDYQLLAVKATLDFFASLAFASTLGVGVIFSAFVLLAYQGGITLLAAQLDRVVNAVMMAEMTAAGGVILLGIAISSMLELKPIRVGSFLPALAIAPLLVALVDWIGKIKP